MHACTEHILVQSVCVCAGPPGNMPHVAKVDRGWPRLTCVICALFLIMGPSCLFTATYIGQVTVSTTPDQVWCVMGHADCVLYVQDPEENAKILSSWTGGIQAVAQLFSYLNQLHIIGGGLVEATECCPVVGHIVGKQPA